MSDTPPENNSQKGDFSVWSAGVQRTKRFRFKEKSRLARDLHAESRPTHQSSSSHQGHRHHSSHHRHKRRKTRQAAIDDPSPYDDPIHSLSPETAFRESLFDAMADDEGATFWESVYGQPIHNYPKTYVDEDTGELEQMDDEEYAQYVRRKMWEKSWEGIEAQREERKKAQRAKEKSRKEEEGKVHDMASRQSARTFDAEVEESLRRGEERRHRKRWKALWDDYVQKWASLQQLVEEEGKESADTGGTSLQNKIAWPVESGKRDDLLADDIEKFILNGTQNTNLELDRETNLLNALKVERIRWHPDKMQQRFGSRGIDDKILRGVTAVFQVVDRMWSERREQK